MSHDVSNHCLFKSNISFVNQLCTVSVPNSVQEVLDGLRCKTMMNKKMKFLKKTKIETWELVNQSPRKKLVGCQWIYTVKYKVKCTIEHFKARLVAKQYTPTYKIDYMEAFAPIAKINIVRVLLSLVVN